MTAKHLDLLAVARHYGTYPYEAYLFLLEALDYTQRTLHRQQAHGPHDGHVSGFELSHGVRRYANECFGLLASTVLRRWGIKTTDDIGEIIFNLIEAGILCKSDHDSPADFHAVFDLHRALTDEYEIVLPEPPEPSRWVLP